MTRDDVIAMARKAGAAAEREKVARWMMLHSYATGHGDTTEDLLKELEWQVRERIDALRTALSRKALDELAEIDRELGLEDMQPEIIKTEIGKDKLDEPIIDKSAAKRIATQLGWEPKREWVGLTDDEIDEIIGYVDPHCQEEQFARAIEAKLKEKNT